jgi:hypothetical protein
MTKLLLSLLLLFAVTPQFAKADIWEVIGTINDIRHPSPRPPRRPPPPSWGGHITCTASDRGWEEHWGGHHSCGECLSKHGECVETCTAETQVCQAKGLDWNGQLVTVTGESSDRWDAERRAWDSCQYRGLRDCRVESCESRDEQISRRSCR